MREFYSFLAAAALNFILLGFQLQGVLSYWYYYYGALSIILIVIAGLGFKYYQDYNRRWIKIRQLYHEQIEAELRRVRDLSNILLIRRDRLSFLAIKKEVADAKKILETTMVKACELVEVLTGTSGYFMTLKRYQIRTKTVELVLEASIIDKTGYYARVNGKKYPLAMSTGMGDLIESRRDYIAYNNFYTARGNVTPHTVTIGGYALSRMISLHGGADYFLCMLNKKRSNVTRYDGFLEKWMPGYGHRLVQEIKVLSYILETKRLNP